MSKCIKYGIFSYVCDRAIRGPKYYETNFRIFIPQDDKISCPPSFSIEEAISFVPSFSLLIM
jgi:hypothetical protein